MNPEEQPTRNFLLGMGLGLAVGGVIWLATNVSPLVQALEWGRGHKDNLRGVVKEVCTELSTDPKQCVRTLCE